MGQILHGSATTAEAFRRAIQHSQERLRTLAGRYGIQTAPALARLSAELILGEVNGLMLDKQTVASLSPNRFGRSALD